MKNNNMSDIKKESNINLQHAFEVLHRNQNFEEQVFWNRNVYFSFLTGFLLIAYYLISQKTGNNKFPLFLLNIIGVLTSIAWYYANKSGKFWHEYWQAHNKNLNKKVFGVLFDPKSISYNPTKNHNIFDAYPFSITKISILMSVISIFNWIAIFLITALKGYILTIESYTNKLIYLELLEMFLFSILLLGVMLLFLYRKKAINNLTADFAKDLVNEYE